MALGCPILMNLARLWVCLGFPLEETHELSSQVRAQGQGKGSKESTPDSGDSMYKGPVRPQACQRSARVVLY